MRESRRASAGSAARGRWSCRCRLAGLWGRASRQQQHRAAALAALPLPPPRAPSLTPTAADSSSPVSHSSIPRTHCSSSLSGEPFVDSTHPLLHLPSAAAPSAHGAPRGPRRAAPGSVRPWSSAAGPWSCAAAGPAGARHGGLLPPPLRRLPPELRRWPSTPHPPPCAGAGRRPSLAPSAASADGGARRGGEGVICIYAPLSQQAQSTLDPTWRST